MPRTTPDSVALDFERTIPMMGDHTRTTASTRARPPYYDLLCAEGKAQIVFCANTQDAPDKLTDIMSVKDMARVLEGMRLADYIRNAPAPQGASDEVASQ